MDDRSAYRIEAVHPELAVDDGLDIAACRRHAPDVDVAVILDREENRVALPDGLADGRERPALAVELLGEHAPLAGRDIDDGNAVVAGPVEAAGAPVARDRGTVRGPRGQVVEVVVLRQSPRLPTGCVDEPDRLP